MGLEKKIKNQKAKNNLLKNKGEKQKVYSLIKNYADNNDGDVKGEQFTVCSKCGKEFEQDFVPDRNAFTDWKTCKECRKLMAEDKTKKVKGKEKEVSVAQLHYDPFPWQIEAAEAFETHRFQVLSCGNRCFTKGNFINGCDKMVEDITEDDVVFGHYGRMQEIVQIQKLPYSGDVCSIKATGLLPIEVSANHRIWVSVFNKKSKGIIKEEFVEAKDLKKYIDKLGKDKNAYLKMQKPKDFVDCDKWEFDYLRGAWGGQLQPMPINEDTAWMIGLYCAEGCFLGRGGCKWTLNYKELEITDRLCSILDKLNLHYNVRERENAGTRCVVVTKKQFCEKMDKEVGHGSLNKKIPASILYNSDEKILVSFLKGYYAGDGSLIKSIGVLGATTVSNTLSIQLQFAWTRLGHYAKITTSQRKRQRLKKDGTIGIESKEYKIAVNEPRAIRRLGYEIEDKQNKNNVRCIKVKGAIYTPITDVSNKFCETDIYAITTEDGSIECGNVVVGNSGKDRYSIMTGIKYFVECLNENRAIDNPDMVPPVLWWQLAPTEKMAKQNWRELKTYFPKEWVVARSDSAYQMETIGGGIIEVRSGYDPDALVGVGLDLVTITEAARFKDLDLAWANLEARLNSPGRGRKKDRMGKKYGQGKAIINSSPLGKNDFYRLFCYGQKDHTDYSSVWWSAQYAWTCNPANEELANTYVKTKYGELTYEESLRRQLGERTFKSNYLADFLAEDGAVFKNFEEKCVVNLFSNELNLDSAGRKEFIKNWQKVEPGATYTVGYDPATGSSSDSPAVVVMNNNNYRIVRIFDLYGKNYEQQWDFIANIAKQYNYATVNWLRTGHTAIEGQFEKRGVSEYPIDENGGKKAELVQKLELAVENGDLQVLADGSDEAQTLIYQMNDYSEKKNGKYSNDQMPHDDFVSCLYAVFSEYSVESAPIAYCGIIGSVY